jgi:hypothetical protein
LQAKIKKGGIAVRQNRFSGSDEEQRHTFYSNEEQIKLQILISLVAFFTIGYNNNHLIFQEMCL